jgi:hypothetical protein
MTGMSIALIKKPNPGGQHVFPRRHFKGYCFACTDVSDIGAVHSDPQLRAPIQRNAIRV